jgi:GWxTD domain-containing protein
MRRFLPAFVCLLLLPAAAAAQPADTTFRAFYETLSTLPDSSLKAAAVGNDPLHAAFASLELHKRTSNVAHASRAVRLLGGVLKKTHEQPWAHLGLALGLLRTPKSINILRSYGIHQEASGAEPVKAAIHSHLQLALKYDPTLHEARELLADFAGDPYTAIAEIADYESGGQYFSALDRADEAAFDNLVRDVALVASSQEILTMTQGDFEKRKNALRLFWKKRGVRDGITGEARILEHYRRIEYARENYGRPVPYYTVFGKKRVGLETEMDDRGLIYVRYGAPHNVDLVADEVAENRKRKAGAEVWAYRQPDGRHHVYIFINGKMEADPLRFVANGGGLNAAIESSKMMDVLQRYDARYHFIAMRQENVRLAQFMARANPGPESRAYAARIANSAAEDAAKQNDRIAEKNRRMLFAAFDMDAARPRFPRQLTLFHDFATFRGANNRCTDVVFSVAAPAASYNLTLAVADTFTWEAQSIDTTVVGNVARGEFLRTTGIFCMTPDYNAYVRLTATADSATGVTAGGDLQIPDYSESGLKISSMLFAKTEDGPFIRGNARLSLVPPNQFREDEAFRIFYELYNLPAGRPYRTEITVTTTDGNYVSRLFKGKTSTRVTFEGVAEGRDVVQELRTLIPQIEPGEAEVVVKVTDLTTNESAQTKKTIWILPTPEPVKN